MHHELGAAFRELAATTDSRLYASLTAQLAERPDVLSLLEGARPEQRLPLLLLAAVHHEVLREGVPYPADAEAFAAFCEARRGRITELVATHRTQTNEVGRSGLLLPCLALLPEPLALIEVGASAGLNLNLDHYEYHYGERVLGSSPVVLAPELRGPAPPVERIPRITSRVGVDLAPAPEADWLRACVWPDQPERLARLEAALRIAYEHPPPLVQGDALELLPELIAAAEGTVVVFHSAVTFYFDDAQRAALDSLLEGVHHVSVEPEPDWDSFLVRVDGERVARAHPHGTWLAWEA